MCRINETVIASKAAKTAAIFLSMSLALIFPRPATADAVTDWNVNAGKAALAACIQPAGSSDPGNESRLYAMMHVAIHDALNAIDRRFRPYVFDVQGATGASREAAVASAARNVLVQVISKLPATAASPACVHAGIASVEADYAAAIAALPNNDARMLGIQLGQSSAAAIVAFRSGDGSEKSQIDPNCPDPNKTEAGEFLCVPGFPIVAAESWGHVTPFVLHHVSQFRPSPPHKLSSKKYAADFNEVKAFGGDGIGTPTRRTLEQTQFGLFWLEGSVLTWNRIARNVSANRGLDLWENARLFGLLNLAVADAYIAHFDAKYHYNRWRPVTAVRLAESDGNPDTVGDPTWTPLQQNYPTPTYPSGHSTAGGAAAQVLQEFFGTDNVGFSVCTLTLNGCAVSRQYVSFSQAAEENALSRILVGLHFRNDVEEGVKLGRKIGGRAANLFLRPVQ
jgi:hypothetical protein